MRYELIYILDTGRAISFSFSPEIDFEKYNRTILSMYKGRIVKRYVVDNLSNTTMSLRQLKDLLSQGEKG